MMLNLNEQAAIQLVLNFIDTKMLLTAAADGFNEYNTAEAIEAADLIQKAINTYLSR